MSGEMMMATPSWQDRAIAELATSYEFDDDSKAIARTALSALGQVLHDKQLYSPHTITEPTIMVGGQLFAVSPSGPEVPATIVKRLASSPILRQYADGGKLTEAGIQALLNNPAAIRSIFGDRLPILACMDVD